MPRNTGPRFPPLAVVCNGSLSIAKQEWGAALTIVKTAFLREVLAGAPGVLYGPSIDSIENGVVVNDNVIVATESSSSLENGEYRAAI